MSSGPLTGIRVVDCSRGTAGTRLTQFLADYGADVVWVEPPGGDPWREVFPVEYSVFNRNKRSVELDLKTSDGRNSLLDLASRADVFVQSWRPGVAESLGVDSSSVRSRAPGIVYCSISGFGPDGPLSVLPGHEAIVHAIAGTTAEQAGMRAAPIFEAIPFASIGAAFLGATGVLAGLVRSRSTGTGCEVETSLLDGALAYLMMLWGDTDVGGGLHLPGANKIVARTFLCADGEYIGVHTGAVGAFGRLMTVLGIDDRIPASDNPLEMGVPLTQEQALIVGFEIPTIFESKPRSEWLRLLRAADICAVEHLHPGECFDAPQVRHNNMVVELDDPVLGPVEQVSAPIRVNGTAISPPTPAPVCGTTALADLDWDTRTVEAGAPGSDAPPLSGVKVLDLGAFYAGPYASRVLADLGADVIKLEPIHGDPVRGLNVVFRSANAGKRSIAMNLKDDGLAEARHALIEWADVIHHNMRPGVAERLGLGYDQVRAINDDVVYLYAPGWGSTGPDVDRQSFAPKLAGYVGAGFEVAGQFNPPLFPVGNEDPGGGVVGALGILLGLLAQRRTGTSQYVESAQLNGAMTLVSHIVRRPGGETLGAGRLDVMQFGLSALERLYATADGWICISALADHHFETLHGIVGTALDDERFADRSARSDNDDTLASVLEEFFAGATSAHWEKLLGSAGVPVAAPHTSPNSTSFLRDPENRRTGRVAETNHPRDKKVREIDQLIRFAGLERPVHRVAPDLGSSTDDVLTSIGYSTDRITDLRDRRVIV